MTFVEELVLTIWNSTVENDTMKLYEEMENLFKENFPSLESEIVICYCGASLISKLSAGWLFLTNNHLCFSTITGDSILIPLKKLLNIEQKKHGFVLHTKNDNYDYTIGNSKNFLQVLCFVWETVMIRSLKSAEAIMRDIEEDVYKIPVNSRRFTNSYFSPFIRSENEMKTISSNKQFQSYFRFPLDHFYKDFEYSNTRLFLSN
jgi:hypothetical protein